MTSLAHKAGAVLLLQDYAGFMGKNLYNSKTRDYLATSALAILEKKVVRLQKVKELFDAKKLKMTYFGGDVVEFARMCPDDHVFISFPPFFKGDYEKQYKFLDDAIDSDALKPTYPMFDENSLVELVKILKTKKFLIATNKYDLFADDPDIKCIGYNFFSKNEMVHFITNIDSDIQFTKMAEKVWKRYDVQLITKEDIDAITRDTVVELKEIPLDLLDSVRRTRISSKVKKLSAPLFKAGVFIE